MKKALKLALGIVTSIGGFFDAGNLATAAQAGANFGFQLLWVVLLGTVCLIFLTEMSGRLAACSGHTVADSIRARFGFKKCLFPAIAESIAHYLLLASEIGGVCIALQLLTGYSIRWWAIPVALFVWMILWKGTFSLIEDGVSILGLVALCFVVAAIALRPDHRALLAGFVPSLPDSHPANYWFIAVSILGATISPFLFYFYSSGAVEEKWDKSDLRVNKGIAVLGMGFGSVVTIGVVITAAMVLGPYGIQADRYHEVALLLTKVFGFWGFPLFLGSVLIACLGASLEVTLGSSYMIAQALGWNWGENLKPKENARFALTYSAFVFLAALPVLIGIDPLKLTMFSMAIITLVLPPAVLPFLVIMNDSQELGEHRNGWLSNSIVIFVTLLAFVLAIVAIPLQIAGG